MNSAPYFDVVISRIRGDKKRWHKIGRAWFNPAADARSESLVLDLNSLPPGDGEIKLFPPAGQAPLACAERFSAVVAVSRNGDDRPYWHPIGLAFHNPPSDDRAENFRVILDSLPMSGRVHLFPTEEPSTEPRVAESAA